MYSAVPGLNIRLSYRFIIPRWQGSQSFKGKISFCLVVKPGIFWSLPLRSHSCRIFFYRVEKWSEAFPANCTEWPVVTLGLIGCFFLSGTILHLSDDHAGRKSCVSNFCYLSPVSRLCGVQACCENRQGCGTIYNQLVCIGGPRLRWSLGAI